VETDTHSFRVLHQPFEVVDRQHRSRIRSTCTDHHRPPSSHRVRQNPTRSAVAATAAMLCDSSDMRVPGAWPRVWRFVGC
jgi:hypothetical protein